MTEENESPITRGITSKFVVRTTSVPITIGTSVLVGVVYLLELALAGSTQPEAASQFLLSVISQHKATVWLLSPILHSSHVHVTQNLLFFVPFAYLIERRIDSSAFLFFMFLVGYAGTIFNGITMGSIGVGISAINFALQAREAVYRTWVIFSSKTSTLARTLKHSSILAVVLAFVLVGFAQSLQYIESPPGAALAAHFIGILLGFIWQLFRFDDLILKENQWQLSPYWR